MVELNSIYHINQLMGNISDPRATRIIQDTAVFVEDEDKLACRSAVFLAELINSLD